MAQEHRFQVTPNMFQWRNSFISFYFTGSFQEDVWEYRVRRAQQSGLFWMFSADILSFGWVKIDQTRRGEWQTASVKIPPGPAMFQPSTCYHHALNALFPRCFSCASLSLSDLGCKACFLDLKDHNYPRDQSPQTITEPWQDTLASAILRLPG